MGEYKSVSIEELQKGNERMCLSVLRVFGKCDECRVMKDYYTDQKRTKSKGVKPCESAVFSQERKVYLEKEAKIKEQIKKLNLKIEELKGGLEK